MLRLSRRLLPLAVLLLLVPGAFAQSVNFSTDQASMFAPTATGETGLFTTIVGDTLRQGEWSFSIYLNNYDYLAAPAPELRPPARRSYRDMDVEETRLSASFGFGLTDRWEFVASIPYIQQDVNAGDLAGYVNGYPYVGFVDESGIGNLHLGTKFALLDPATSSGRLALSAFVDLPTGDDDAGIATGNADYGLGLHWNRGIFSFAGTYAVIGNRDADDDDLLIDGDFDMPNQIRLDAGLNIPLGFWSRTNWINEINAILFQGGDRQPDDIVYLVTGIRHWFGDSGWGLSAAVRANATMWQSDSDACPIGGLVGLHFAPLAIAALAPPPAPVVLPPPPPEAAPIPPPAEPVAPPRQPQELRTDEIHCEAGSARLTNIAKAILDDVALRMKQEPAATAVVIGYTDNREATGANADLDRRRAQAVRDYLVSRHGIDASRISIEARGTQDPVGDNATADGRLRNRRVVIRLMVP
jgi:outer membrane protein OmpA-like peptidoglycan-associated protein